MKKFVLLTFLLKIGIVGFSQDIYVTFHSTNDKTSIDSILATNINKQISVELSGNDSLLLSSNITSTSDFVSTNFIGKLYPNPVVDEAHLDFILAKSQMVKILVFNQIGKIILAESRELLDGPHCFLINNLPMGINSISIITKNQKLNFKIISLKKNLNSPEIRYSGLSIFKSQLLKSVNDNQKSSIESLKYEVGDIIHFKCFSENNTTIIADSPTESKDYNVDFFKCMDMDSMHYSIVQIGDQWWMAENLAWLPEMYHSDLESETEPYYYVPYYNGDSIILAKETYMYKTYGAFYNWTASINACPEGWHLPSDDEWDQMAQYISDQKGPYSKGSNDWDDDDWNDVGKHLKATGTVQNSDGLWTNDKFENEGTDDFGFSALPAGGRYNSGPFGGSFDYVNELGIWWSSSLDSINNKPRCRNLHFSNVKLNALSNLKVNGFSVRCVKD